MADITLNPKYVRPLVGSTVTLAKAGANLSIGDLVYVDSNQEAQKTDADTLATVTGMVGMIVGSGTYRADGSIKLGEPITILWHGRLALNTDALSPTAKYYVSNTPGKLSDAAGTNSRVIGSAENKNVFIFDGNPA